MSWKSIIFRRLSAAASMALAYKPCDISDVIVSDRAPQSE